MEKIYEDEQQQSVQKQQKQQKQKKKIKIDGVTMLSFAVALFAIVSLVAAGVSSFSYALPSSTVELPDTFTGAEDDSLMIMDNLTMQETEYHYYNDGSSNIPLVCLQRDVTFNAGTFSKASSETISDDAGLLYLLANLAPNATITYPSGFNIPSGKQDRVDFWVSQTAIWYYLNGTDKNEINAEDFAKVPNVSWVYIGDTASSDSILAGSTCSNNDKCFGFGDNSKKIYDEVKVNGVSIKTLVANAKSKSGMSYGISLSDGEGVVSTDDEKKYYFSPLYTVVPSIDSTIGELTSYSLSVKAVDKDGKDVDVGAVITDEGGNVISDVSALKIADISKFYVRIPAKEVTANVTVKVVVNGTFKMYDGNRYTSGANTQEVTTVKFVNKTDSSGKDFDLAPAPDTGISAGQTIYFVGLIVLLCGVGIIYANARPQKSQN